MHTEDVIHSLATGWDGTRGYMLGNVLKHLSCYRAQGGIESLRKARWYLDRLILALEAEE